LLIVADDFDEFENLIPALLDGDAEGAGRFMLGAEVELGHKLGGEGNAVGAPLVLGKAGLIDIFGMTALPAGLGVLMVVDDVGVDFGADALQHVGVGNRIRHDGRFVVVVVVMTVMYFGFSGGGEGRLARKVNPRQLDGVVRRR